MINLFIFIVNDYTKHFPIVSFEALTQYKKGCHDEIEGWGVRNMKILAFLIDFFLGFFGTGWLLTRLTGGTMTFELEGIWLLVWIGLIVAYFLVPKKLWGQSLGRKILGVKKRK